jgi:hypothetical protein
METMPSKRKEGKREKAMAVPWLLKHCSYKCTGYATSTGKEFCLLGYNIM